jgi:hypothetical protein
VEAVAEAVHKTVQEESVMAEAQTAQMEMDNHLILQQTLVAAAAAVETQAELAAALVVTVVLVSLLLLTQVPMQQLLQFLEV